MNKLLQRSMAMFMALIIFSAFSFSGIAYDNNTAVTVLQSRQARVNGTGALYSDKGNENDAPRHYNMDMYHFNDNSITGGIVWVYCIQKWRSVGSGDRVIIDSGNLQDSAYWDNLSEKVKRNLSWATLCGFPAKSGSDYGLSSVTDDDWYTATQIIVWEIITGRRYADGWTQGWSSDSWEMTNGTARAKNDQTYFHYFLYDGTNKNGNALPAKRAYDAIWAAMAKYSTEASFKNSTIDLTWNNGTLRYEGSATDANNIIGDCTITAPGGVTVSRSGNVLSFSSANPISTPVTLTAKKTISATAQATKFAVMEDVTNPTPDQAMMCGAADPLTFNFQLRALPGTGRIVKTSGDNVLNGFSFRIQGNGIDRTVTTPASGIIAETLPPGTYTVSELSVPTRYVTPSSQTLTVTAGGTSTVNFNNAVKKFRVTVTKTDSVTGTAQGNATLAGAVYGIYKGDVLQDTYTTNAAGQFTTNYYPCGIDWMIKEITPSPGYLLDTATHPVGAGPGLFTVEYNPLSMSVTEQVIMGQISILKLVGDGSTQVIQPETGASFQIYLESAGSYAAAKASERDILLCDTNGYAISKKLPFGTYRVHQVSGWPGKEMIGDFLVYVSENGKVYQYPINNAAILSKLKVEKRDAETGSLIAAAGIGFQIKKPDGTLLTMNVDYPAPVTLSVFRTNTEGWLLLPEKLPVGTGYQLIEVETAPGYVLDSTPVLFDVTGEDAIVTVTKYNAPQKGRIHITKTGEVFSTVTERDGLFTPVYESGALAGAAYDIIAEEPITLNGDLKLAKGAVAATVTTTAAGATSPLLYPGLYRLVERVSPSGMVKGEDKLVSIVYNKDVTVTVTPVTLNNERQKAAISLKKSMEQDTLFGIGGDLSAVVFGLYADTDIMAADGSKIPAGGLIERISVDETGRGVFTADIPVGSRVYVREISTDGRYIISDEAFPLVFQYAGQDIATVNLAANDGDPIENRIRRGKVEGKKVGEDAESLSGAVFGLFLPGETVFSEDTALLTAVSDGDGGFAFSDIAPGRWVVRELSPPTGHVLNETPYPVEIDEDGQTVEIVIENRRIRGNIQGMKQGEDGEALAGSVFGLFLPGETEFSEATAVMTAISGEYGGFTFEAVEYGRWVVRELSPSTGHVLNETPYPVEISEDGQTVEIVIENRRIRGNIQGMKHGEDGEALAGSVFGLFLPGESEFSETTAVMTAVSGEDGGFTFEAVEYGHWLVRELSPSTGHVLNETPYPVEIDKDGQMIAITIENIRIRGSVRTVKVDAEYPAIKLSGAVCLAVKT